MVFAQLFWILFLGKETELKIIARKAIDAVNQILERGQVFPGVSRQSGSSLCTFGSGSGAFWPFGSCARMAIVAVLVWLATAHKDAVGLLARVLYGEHGKQGSGYAKVQYIPVFSSQAGFAAGFTRRCCFVMNAFASHATASRGQLADSSNIHVAPRDATGLKWTHLRQAIGALRLIPRLAPAAGVEVDDGLPATLAAGDVDAADNPAVEPNAELAYEPLTLVSIVQLAG